MPAKKTAKKPVSVKNTKEAKGATPDLDVYGDPDSWVLLCKTISDAGGWMKSTKVLNVSGGCVMQVTTQLRNPDGSYAVAEALTYVPGAKIDLDADPRRMIPT
jgi:hypothetical protein